MTATNKIEGVLRLTTPMHCASPDKTTDANGNANITRTHKTRLMTARGPQSIPYFPAGDLRGRLRRKAATIVFDRLASLGKVSVDLYAAMLCGAISAEIESNLTIEEALRAKANPYMGLFGGATRMLRSRYSVNDLMPVLRDTVEAGCVPASFAEAWDPQTTNGAGASTAISGYLTYEERTSFRVDDITRGLNASEMDHYIKDATKAVAERQATVIAARVVRKEDKQAAKDAKAAGEKAGEIGGKTTAENMFAYECIVRGTRMHFLIDFANDATDEHVGLMLLALQALVREQALGGMVRLGFGKYYADLIITRNGQKYAVFTPETNGAEATLSKDVYEAFCEPALAAIGKLSAQDMMEFFTPREAAKPVKEAKAKKQAAGAEAA